MPSGGICKEAQALSIENLETRAPPSSPSKVIGGCCLVVEMPRKSDSLTVSQAHNPYREETIDDRPNGNCNEGGFLRLLARAQSCSSQHQ